MSLEVSGLAFSYDGAPLLEQVDLRLGGGEVGFLLGPSGSGKTTLLRCIAGLARPEAGSVRVDGTEVSATPAHRRRIGLVPQDQALFPHLDVGGNVAFGLRYQGMPRGRRRAEAHRWLAQVGLADRIDDRIDELSGGQRQRVALVRTLATRPRAVLLDEPLSGLDRELRDDVGRRIRDLLHHEGVPGLWVTHDEAEARAWGDRIWRVAARTVVPD